MSSSETYCRRSPSVSKRLRKRGKKIMRNTTNMMISFTKIRIHSVRPQVICRKPSM